MDTELLELRGRFLAYAERHLHQDETTDSSAADNAAIRLKIDHSLRVLENAEYIARTSTDAAGAHGFTSQTLRLCRIAALFHDTGRFPQYRTYRTFRDADSANHASLGVHALLREKLLDGLSRRERGIVLGAIALHNRRAIPAALPEPLGSVVQVVRDADKIDIFQVLLTTLREDDASEGVVVMHAKDDPERYTPVIFDQLRIGQSCDYRDVHWYHDVRMLLLSWIYDLNHPASARFIAERGHFETLLRDLPNTPSFSELVTAIRQDIANILAGKGLALRDARSV